MKKLAFTILVVLALFAGVVPVTIGQSEAPSDCWTYGQVLFVRIVHKNFDSINSGSIALPDVGGYAPEQIAYVSTFGGSEQATFAWVPAQKCYKQVSGDIYPRWMHPSLDCPLTVEKTVTDLLNTKPDSAIPMQVKILPLGDVNVLVSQTVTDTAALNSWLHADGDGCVSDLLKYMQDQAIGRGDQEAQLS